MMWHDHIHNITINNTRTMRVEVTRWFGTGHFAHDFNSKVVSEFDDLKKRQIVSYSKKT